MPFRQIGVELGRKGMSDEEIIPFLLRLARPTFFTRDLGFDEGEFCHSDYCLVVLAVGQLEAAVRRLLNHADFDTQREWVV